METAISIFTGRNILPGGRVKMEKDTIRFQRLVQNIPQPVTPH